ncbi:MAG: MBL fold metallo-hydrolase RNA specificity domain-containing protein [Cyclonatronaceae bacterium]
MMKIEKSGWQGFRLPESGVALDTAGRHGDHVFISHAHADHVPRDRKISVFCSAATAELMRVRGFTGEATILEFLKPLELPLCRVTLYPAGHILGSAMIFVETDEGSLLYTGDFRTPPSPTTEGFESPKQADYLITEATFGLPVYRWKSHDELFGEIRNFATETLAADETPVFLAYNLGKAQEVMHALAPAVDRIMIHGAGYGLCQVYTRFGYDLGHYEAYNRETLAGSVLITPGSSADSAILNNIRRKKIAYCSGWASNDARRVQLNTDAMIPISDHADFFELIAFCKRLQPRHVFITHTPNPDVVIRYLSKEGISSSGISSEGKADE